MAQSATTFLSHNSGYGAIKKMEDIRLSDDKKDNIRQKFMTFFHDCHKSTADHG